MKKLFLVLTLISVLGFSQSVKAQEPDATGFIKTYAQPGGMLSFEWIIGVPVGTMSSDFISSTSTRGFNAEYRYLFNSPISVGGGLSWQGFSEKYDRDTYEFDGGAITSTRFNYLYTFPLYVNFHYYPVKSNYIFPFVGVNIGGVHVDKQDQIGRYYIQTKEWEFMVAPEIGALIKFDPYSSFGISVKVRYNYILYNVGKFNDLSQLNFYVGGTFIF